MRRVGFIVNSRVPELASLGRGMRPTGLIAGWDDRKSPMSFMRFRWLAEALRKTDATWRYEIYRPWRAYEAVVFLKSMGSPCLALARRLRGRGTIVIFEANVDYYTPLEGETPLDAMVPTREQRADARAITEFADAVIGSSRRLSEVCQTFNSRTRWVPDNVNLRLRPSAVQQTPMRAGRLRIWWSGVAEKLFEFLAAEQAFLALADRIHLELVTDDVERAKSRWSPLLRARFEHFLARMPHTFHRFRDIPRLLALYGAGGIVVSPRFLDVPYNFSHTEWKITLGMACHLPAIASPVPSYIDVAERSGPDAVTIAKTDEDWTAALENFLSHPERMADAGHDAQETVRRHYETGVVACQHASWLEEICSRAAP